MTAKLTVQGKSIIVTARPDVLADLLDDFSERGVITSAVITPSPVRPVLRDDYQAYLASHPIDSARD